MAHRIELDPIERTLLIGCRKEERELPQPVLISAAIRSENAFPASRTDQLTDTLDVEAVVEILQRHGADSEFHTLERFAATLEQTLRAHFGHPGLHWEVRIRKPQYGWSFIHDWIA
jgi:FolB domain-containing protein